VERQKGLNIKGDVSVFLPLSSCMKFELFMIRYYCHIGPVDLYYILPHCLINDNGTSFLKSYYVCLDFLYNFCLKHFSLLKEFSEK